MARFLKHVACERCGSSDAKGLYDDGSSWCFSCRRGNGADVCSLVAKNDPNEEGTSRNRVLPSDLSNHFGSSALDWLRKSGIDVETLIKNGVKYSASRQQILFTWKQISTWQARNLHPEARVRYFTSGDHGSDLLLYYTPSCFNAKTCVLTEDCLSAIKVANCGSSVDAMPLLGTHLPTTKLKALKRIYERIDVFLDEDKYKDAMKLSKKIQLAGLKSSVHFSPLDPKHLPYGELKQRFDGPQELAPIVTHSP